MTATVIVALLSAACFATAVVFQQEAAIEANAEPSATGSSIHGLALKVLTRKTWLLATLVDFAGFLLQATALHLGRITVVQPLLVLVLLFGMIIGAWRTGVSLSGSDLLGAVLLCVGLAIFLVAAQPNLAPDENDAIPGRLPMLIISVLGLAILGVVVSRGFGSTGRAISLGLVAGVCFAGVAAIVKTVGGQLTRSGPLPVLEHWQVYSLAVVALTGLAIEQTAFAAGPLVPTLIVLTSIDPLASICTGVLVYGETLTGGAGPVLGAAVGGVLALIGVVLVARSRAVLQVQAPPVTSDAHPAVC